ncbi:MAG: carbohydrate ABC transporter permease [Actinobacteria bacterium]|nr:carbohydrate ABC transporter permease [Actinomycetota bacterium]
MKRTFLNLLIRILFYISTFGLLFVTLIPIIWLVLTSFKPETAVFATPPQWIPKNVTFSNYTEAFKQYSVGRQFINSMGVSLSVVILNILIGTPAGYAFARFRFKGDNAFFIILLLVRMIPMISVLLPLFIMFSALHLLDTWTALILVHTAAKLPVTIWLMRGFFREIPREIEESAKIDGCSILQTLRRVAFPLAAPGVGAAAIMAFIFTWNDLITATILTSTDAARPMTVGLMNFVMQFRIAWGPMTAAGTLMLIPAVIFCIWAERYLVRGLTFGAVKG